MARLNTRTSELSELASLKNGDLVTVYDDGSVTGLTWEDAYVWRPAGSQVQMTDMYARWGDGLVAINMQTDPADASDDLIPNNAWLFHSAGNGQYTALVDVLEFRSGSTPVRQEETETTFVLRQAQQAQDAASRNPKFYA